MNDTKIYVITHKMYPILNDDIHFPLLVGSDFKNDDYGYLCDNLGENISYKNGQFCELTGLYWIWKNSGASIVGLCHYRRYFAHGIFGNKGIINKRELQDYLNNYDILVHKRFFGIKIYDNFANMIGKDILDKSLTVFNEVYPEYSDDLMSILNQRSLYCCNMFVASKELINDYCEWLFNYLNILEDRMDNDNLRIYGYIAEFVFATYIRHNKFKIKNCPLNYVEAKSNVLSNFIDSSFVIGLLYTFYWNIFEKK